MVSGGGVEAAAAVSRNKVLSGSFSPRWYSAPVPAASSWRRVSRVESLYRSPSVAVRRPRGVTRSPAFCVEGTEVAVGLVDDR